MGLAQATWPETDSHLLNISSLPRATTERLLGNCSLRARLSSLEVTALF